MEDMQQVLHGRPWTTIGSFPLLLKQWEHGMKLDTSSLQSLPVWVNFMELDLQFWTPHLLSKISSMLGKSCSVDKLMLEFWLK